MIDLVKKFIVSASSEQKQSTSLVAVAIVLVIIYLSLKLRTKYSFFSDRNVPGPLPLPLLGHLHDFLLRDMGAHSVKLMRQYGPIYGVYFGLEPRLMLADPQIISQICIKDFDSFTDHHGLELKTKFQENFLFLQKGNVWRRNRIFISPTFTSGKIKQMYKLLDVCAQDLTQLIGEQISQTEGIKKGAIIEAKNVFSMYTLDAIARCCYGLNLERTKGVFSLKEASARNEFVAMCSKIFNNNLARVVPQVLFPTKMMKSLGYTVVPQSTFEPVAQAVQKMVQARKEVSKNKNQRFYDYLQMLVDAKIDHKMELDHLDSAENHHANLTHESLHKDQANLVMNVVESIAPTTTSNQSTDLKRTQLNDLEVVSNAMFLLFVGLETTASLLSSCVYALSFQPEIQEKLFEQVSKIADRDENGNVKFDYEKLTTCKYLDAVISETLRHSPIVPMIDRQATRDYHFEKLNFSIPKGTVLYIAIQAVHHNSHFWPDPLKFDPERFMPGNKEKIVPGTYMPFGQGPRHCVGMRFSLTEGKLALARVIMKFQFENVPGLRFPAQRKRGFLPGGLRDPRVIVRERNF